MKKVVFLFGAGAEYNFELPSGPYYTYESILRKKDTMHNALKEFYDGKKLEEIPEYTDLYKKIFHLRKGSAVYYKMIDRSIERCIHEGDDVDRITEITHTPLYLSWKLYKEAPTKEKSIQDEKFKFFKIEADNVLNQFINENGVSEPFNYLMNYLEPTGVIERDFASIINPKVLGNDKFWRLVNYFWSAYFTIMIPLLVYKQQKIVFDNEIFPITEKASAYDRYTYILKHIEDISEFIESPEFIRARSKGINNIYSTIKETFELDNVSVITLNYTSLCKGIELGDNSNYAFLAGTLSHFEFPHKLYITNSLKNEHEKDKESLFFPYLCTQAPIKPIVGGSQIKEYAKAIKFLEGKSNEQNYDENVLIIFGCSLCKEDNHLNAIIRDYVIQGGKIIYCKFRKSKESVNDNVEKVLIELRQKLKISKKEGRKIEVVFHSEDTTDIFKDKVFAEYI